MAIICKWFDVRPLANVYHLKDAVNQLGEQGENIAGNGIPMCVPSTSHSACSFDSECRFKHMCRGCAGNHPVKACTFKPRTAEQ